MQMIVRRQTPAPRRLGILPGSFNPPTRAHVALARAALEVVDEVLFVLPRAFPHKTFDGASFEQRVAMLEAVTTAEDGFSAGISDGGLFIEIARDAREHFPAAELHVLCGRDAAERIIGWDYGYPDAVSRMLEVFHLLVAPRNGPYVPPAHLAHAVRALEIENFDECSATAVRDAIAAGAPWEHLVPERIVDAVRDIYARA